MFCCLQNTVAHMSKLRIMTSHKYLYKKLDEFGKDHTQKLKDAVIKQGFYMQHNLKENIAEECSMQNLSTQETRSSITNPATVTTTLIPDCGRKMTLDYL